MPPSHNETFRFQVFELDVPAYELRRQGRPIKLNRQSMDLLILLVENRRRLVSRSEIIDRLWGKDVFVDVDTGVNTAISKIRQALRDSTEHPSFVETVPGKGYRFVATVDVLSEPLESVAPASSRISLAVLPFENLASDAEHEYLAMGLTEDTSASLAQIDPERLSVKGRTFRYKGTTKSVEEIGRELAVDYLVDSSIRSEGGRVRVTAKLIRVRDQEHVWSQSYEREPTSLLGLQQELSTAIAAQVHLTLSPDRLSGFARRQTSNASAYDAFLRGRHFETRRTAATNALAVEQYRRAIALDADYALAWSSLAFTYAGSLINADTRPADVAPLARDAATQAVRANPVLAEAQVSVGFVNWMLNWDWEAAEAALRLAIHLDSSDAQSHRLLGHVLSQAGRHDEAASSMGRSRELEPLEPLGYALSSQVAFQARRYPVAIEHGRHAVLIDSAFWIGHIELGQAYEQTGETELALESLRYAARFSGGNSKVVSLTGYLLAKTGRTSEAREVLRQLEASAAERYMPPYAMALIHAGLGDRDAVFGRLEQAYRERDVHLMYLPVDPKWDDYRTDARFGALLAHCGFSQQS